MDGAGTLYIADRDNHRIRTVSPDGVVRTLAGSGAPGLADGPGAQAQFHSPSDVAVDAAGTVYVMDTFNYRGRRISPAGVVSTLAGGGDVGPDQGGYADGAAAVARFSYATGLTVDGAGTVYVADDAAQFDEPQGIAIGADGTVYVADTGNRRVRVVRAAP